jgi:REP element-mobilizing transposase RayT
MEREGSQHRGLKPAAWATVTGLGSTYHVWFATKRRHWLMVGEIGETARTLLVDTAREKGIHMLECQTIVDHVHMLVECDSVTELSWIMKLLKGRHRSNSRAATPSSSLTDECQPYGSEASGAA